MSRFVRHETVQNVGWSVLQEDNGKYSDAAVTRAILMDIRTELQKLNRVFECRNFLAIPRTLLLIQQQTRKPKRRKAKKVSA